MLALSLHVADVLSATLPTWCREVGLTPVVPYVTSATGGRAVDSNAVPKIDAPTVAEHRANRLRLLLDTAREIVTADGPGALTLAKVAARVGLSRPSLYEYFHSRDDLVAAIVEDEIPAWVAEITAQVARRRDPRAKVRAFVALQLQMLADGRHAAAVALAAHALGDDSRSTVRDAHLRLVTPLVEALTAAGVDAPELRARLIQGIVNAASALLRPGDNQANARLIAAAQTQAIDGLGTPAGTRTRRA